MNPKIRITSTFRHFSQADKVSGFHFGKPLIASKTMDRIHRNCFKQDYPPSVFLVINLCRYNFTVPTSSTQDEVFKM